MWKPRKVANPDFFEDLHPFRMSPFSAVGLELWSMSSDIFFDNFFITNERHTADRWATDGWGLKKAAEGAAEVGGAWTRLLIPGKLKSCFLVVFYPSSIPRSVSPSLLSPSSHHYFLD